MAHNLSAKSGVREATAPITNVMGLKPVKVWSNLVTNGALAVGAGRKYLVPAGGTSGTFVGKENQIYDVDTNSFSAPVDLQVFTIVGTDQLNYNSQYRYDLAGNTYSVLAEKSLSGLFAAGASKTASVFRVQVDTTAGAIDLTDISAPSAFPGVEDGDVIEFIKSSTDSNVVSIDDTNTGGANLSHFTLKEHDFVNAFSESIAIKAMGATDKWAVNV